MCQRLGDLDAKQRPHCELLGCVPGVPEQVDAQHHGQTMIKPPQPDLAVGQERRADLKQWKRDQSHICVAQHSAASIGLQDPRPGHVTIEVRISVPQGAMPFSFFQ